MSTIALLRSNELLSQGSGTLGAVGTTVVATVPASQRWQVYLVTIHSPAASVARRDRVYVVHLARRYGIGIAPKSLAINTEEYSYSYNLDGAFVMEAADSITLERIVGASADISVELSVWGSLVRL